MDGLLLGRKWMKGKKHSKETREKMRQAQLKNPTRYWLGKEREIRKSRTKRNGYIYVSWSFIKKEFRKYFIKNKGNQVAEHQYVWVKNTKQIIPKGFHIHHLNGIKTDNRIENLLLIKAGEHTTLHLKGKPKLRKYSVW